MSVFIFIVFIHGFLVPLIRNGLCDEHEYRLTRYLMDSYDAGVRPAKNSSLPLVVVFGVSLHHIIDVDEKKSDPYNKLLGDSNLDGSSFKMERI